MKNIYFLLSFVVLVSCSNNNPQNSRFSEEQIASLHLDSTKLLHPETETLITIDLNPFLKEQDFDFGSLVAKVKLIPLETTDESLISGIYKILVTDSLIFIHDSFKGGGILIFDMQGKFVKRIPNGQGPGELVRLYDIAYDSENNELVAYVHSFLSNYSINYSKKKLPNKYLYGDSWNDFHAAIEQNDYYYIGKYLETESHSVFFLENNYIRFQTVIFLDKKTGNLVGGTNATYTNTEMPPMAFPQSAFGNWFVSSYLPGKDDYALLSNSLIISQEDKVKLKGLTEDDNQVLVLFQLKDF